MFRFICHLSLLAPQTFTQKDSGSDRSSMTDPFHLSPVTPLFQPRQAFLPALYINEAQSFSINR